MTTRRGHIIIIPRILGKIALYPLFHWMQNISLARAIYGRVSQEFWQEITGDPEFYKKLIIFIENDVVAKKRKEYTTAWERAVNKYVREFTTDFCLENGAIDWEKLVEYNSGKKPPRQTKHT